MVQIPKWIVQSFEDKWVIVQEGTDKVIAFFDSQDQARKAFENVMTSQWVQYRGDKWVIVQEGTGKILASYDSEIEMEKAF